MATKQQLGTSQPRVSQAMAKCFLKQTGGGQTDRHQAAANQGAYCYYGCGQVAAWLPAKRQPGGCQIRGDQMIATCQAAKQ